MTDLVTLPLKEEGGITVHSTHNAKVLIEQYGKPLKVELHEDGRFKEHLVTATWRGIRSGSFIEFTFTGFSWGYYGEGCRGLYDFLQSLGMKIPISRETIASWQQENFPSLTFILGEDY